MKQSYIIEYLNCKKHFQEDSVKFQGPQAYEEAVTWGRNNLENFTMDMIQVVYLHESLNPDDGNGLEKYSAVDLKT